MRILSNAFAIVCSLRAMLDFASTVSTIRLRHGGKGTRRKTLWEITRPTEAVVTSLLGKVVRKSRVPSV